MITITAKIYMDLTKATPFTIGQSIVGGSNLIGATDIVEVEFSKRNLNAIETALFDRSDTKLPSYGIISNVGSMDFVDHDMRFLGYANANLLQSGIKVELFLNNTLTKQSKQIGVLYTSTWDYDNDNRSVSVSLKDDLEELQDIYFDGINYDPRKPQSQTLAWFYNKLKEETPSKYGIKEIDELPYFTREILNTITINYPLLNQGSLWEQWQKLCEVGGLYMHKDYNNKTTFNNEYGV